MPFSNGVYSAPSSPGSFNPAISGQSATPSAWNTLLTDLASALSSTILKDGTQTITADIPWAGFKITGLGDAENADDAVNAGQISGSSIIAVDDTGAADAYVIDPAVPISAYAAYQRFQFIAANANTTASTIAVSMLAAKDIKNVDGSALVANQILVGSLVDIQYDGTDFILLAGGNNQTIAKGGTVAGTLTMSGAAINEAKGADIASASTTDIGSATGNFVHVTGTTTITALGTVQAGTRRIVEFTGALILTHNASSLILPGGANITTAAGDCATFVSEGSGNWRCVVYEPASGPKTNSLSGDVTLNGTFQDGPTVSQGTSGTWFASGSVTILSGTASVITAKLWDGTTVIDSTQFSQGVSAGSVFSLSGYLANPAGNLRISVKSDQNDNVMKADQSGQGNDSTISAIRIL